MTVITKDGGCMRDLLWKVLVKLPCQTVIERLIKKNYQYINHNVFSVLVSPLGHKVIIVHSTSRIQIRIDLVTPYEQRYSQALDCAQHLLSDE